MERLGLELTHALARQSELLADRLQRGGLAAEAAAVHVDRLAELREDVTLERMHTAEEACELVRAAWREAEELQVSTPLALEALLIRLRSELGATAAVA